MNLIAPEEMEIQTRFIRIAAKQWGSADGLPVLALHGWLDNANTFDHLAPLLPRLRMIALDLPGHGRSDHRPAGVRYHFGDYVDDVLGVADVLGWERFALMGHSMGGGVASLCAAAFPERVSHLIQLEGFGVVTHAAMQAPEAMRRAVLAMQEPPHHKQAGYAQLEELIAARAKASGISLASARLLIERAVTRDGSRLIWCSDQRLLMPTPHCFSDESMLAFLSCIVAPVLLISGVAGTLKKRPYFESRRMAVKDLYWVELPGNHHLHMDHPEPVARAIDEFLRQNE